MTALPSAVQFKPLTIAKAVAAARAVAARAVAAAIACLRFQSIPCPQLRRSTGVAAAALATTGVAMAAPLLLTVYVVAAARPVMPTLAATQSWRRFRQRCRAVIVLTALPSVVPKLMTASAAVQMQCVPLATTASARRRNYASTGIMATAPGETNAGFRMVSAQPLEDQGEGRVPVQGLPPVVRARLPQPPRQVLPLPDSNPLQCCTKTQS